MWSLLGVGKGKDDWKGKGVSKIMGNGAVAVMGDVTRCFELAQWPTLRRNALHLAYPATTLRLSVAARG